MTEMMNKMLESVKPDFVVFTGDQIESLIWPMVSPRDVFFAPSDFFFLVVDQRAQSYRLILGPRK